MKEEIRKLEHAFWDMADILADNLQAEDPDEEDSEVAGYVADCSNRFEGDKREFESAMKKIMNGVENKDDISTDDRRQIYKEIQHKYDIYDAETILEELTKDGCFETALSGNERKSLMEMAVANFRNHHNWLLSDYDQLRMWLIREKDNLGY